MRKQQWRKGFFWSTSKKKIEDVKNNSFPGQVQIVCALKTRNIFEVLGSIALLGEIDLKPTEVSNTQIKASKPSTESAQS